MAKEKILDSKLHPKTAGETIEYAASVLAGVTAKGTAGEVCQEVDATVGSDVSPAVEDVEEGPGTPLSLPSDDVDLESLRGDFSVSGTNTKQVVMPCGSKTPRDRFIQILPFSWKADLAECINCLPVYAVDHEVAG